MRRITLIQPAASGKVNSVAKEVTVMTQATDRLELAVAPREVLGKKVRFLRREGITPANIYGHGVDSLAVQVPTHDLAHTIKVAGRNTMLQLHVEGEKKARPVFVHHVQRNPLNDDLLHVDFYQVSMKEKIRLEVPIVVVGEAPAVDVYHGILLQNTNSVAVEGLPGEMPPHIEVDVSGLAEIDDAIHIKDLPVSAALTLLVDPELVVVKVAPPRIEVEEEVAEEEVEAAEVAEVAEEEAKAEKAEKAEEES
jgi:large subunit ribosomal protein L25